MLDGNLVDQWTYEDSLDKLVVKVDIDLNQEAELRWK
jgi:hypothetical protein